MTDIIGYDPRNIAHVCAVNYCNKNLIYFQNRSLAEVRHMSLLKRYIQNIYRYKGCDSMSSLNTSELEEAVSGFDIIFCSFPSWQCYPFLKMGKKIIIRFSHSPWHGCHNSDFNDLWISSLIRGQKQNSVFISSNNPYHASLFYHVSGVFPIPWAALYYHVWQKRKFPDTRFTRQIVLVGLNPLMNPFVKEFIQELMNTKNTDWNWITFEEHMKNGENWEKILLAVIFLYALHTAKITEIYYMGIPIILPSLGAILNLYSMNIKAIPHRDFVEIGNSHVHGGHCIINVNFKDHNSNSFWISLSELYMWPGIYKFNEWNSSSLVQSINRDIYRNKSYFAQVVSDVLKFRQLQLNRRSFVKHFLIEFLTKDA